MTVLGMAPEEIRQLAATYGRSAEQLRNSELSLV